MAFVFVFVFGRGAVMVGRHQTARVRLRALPAPLSLRPIRRRHLALADPDLQRVTGTRDGAAHPADCQLGNTASIRRRCPIRARQMILGNGDLQFGLITVAVTMFVLLFLLMLFMLLLLLVFVFFVLNI